eukprot:Gb_20032 [translate_table: standard]
MDDPQHLEKFNHCYSSGLQVGSDDLKNLQPQQLDYFLVLDLEGMVEILEFPVVMIDARSLEFVDAFHRLWKLLMVIVEIAHSHDTAVKCLPMQQDLVDMLQQCIVADEFNSKIQIPAESTGRSNGQ